MTTQSLAIPNAAQMKSPVKKSRAKKATTAKTSTKKPQRVEDLLEEGSISWEDWKKSPDGLALQKWEDEHPEEAEQIRREVLEEMGLAG